MRVTARDLQRWFQIAGSEEGQYMQYDAMVKFLVTNEGLSEREARRSIREDLFKGLLQRSERGYRVNPGYTFEVVE